jgi:hypothetical protein
VRRRAGRSLVLAVLAAVVVTGCGGGAAPTGPNTTDVPSPSVAPLSEAELAVCDGTVLMREGVARLERIRVRRGAGDSIVGALDLVLEGQRLVLDDTPGRLRQQARTLGFAVTNLTIAVEGFRTTDRMEAAAATIKRRTTALRKAIDTFRASVGCPGPTAPPASIPASEAPAG